jgi:ligand-binding sensor domain-containing protein/serine phosphatase RsbU (regulator of sigma subunit)
LITYSAFLLAVLTAQAQPADPIEGPNEGGASKVARWLQPALNGDPIKVQLPTSVINSFAQDGDGFMWMGTHSGLVRYDGLKTTVITHLTAGMRLPDVAVTALLADEDGSLWVGTNAGGLARVDPRAGSTTVYGAKQGLAGHTINSLANGPDKALWIGSNDGLTRLDKKTGEVKAYRHDDNDPASLSSDAVLALYVDGEALWVGTAVGPDRLDRSTAGFVHYKDKLAAPGAVTAFAKGSHGQLWVGSKMGLYSVAGDVWHHYASRPGDHWSLASNLVSDLIVDTDGALWVATEDNGLCQYDEPSSRFFNYLPRNIIRRLFLDHDGVLWVARDNQSIWLVPPASFTTYLLFSADSPLRSPVPFIYPKAGKVWVGVAEEGGGIYAFDRGSGDLRLLQNDPSDPGNINIGQALRVAEDQEGNLWFGSWFEGLRRFNPGTWRAKAFVNNPDDQSSLPSDKIGAIRTDRQGRVWVGTMDAGISRYRPDHGFVRYGSDRDPPERRMIVTIRPDINDSTVMWVGTAGGLVKLNAVSGDQVVFVHNPQDVETLASNFVTSIYQESADTLWVTTNGGLNRLNAKTGKVKRFGEKDGLPPDVTCVLGDKKGLLWVTGPARVSRLDPKTESFVHFDSSDGIKTPEGGDDCCHVGPDTGEIYLGGVGGFTIFDPEKVRVRAQPPRTAISRVQRFDEDVPLPKTSASTLTFSYRDVVQIGFSVLSYSGTNVASYFLEGLDERWISAGQQSSVTYSHLPAGEYTFRVKGANRHGVWDETGASLRFRVNPPPWRSWWAYSGYFAVLASIVAGAANYQRRRVQRLQEQIHIEELERDLDVGAAAQAWFLPKQTQLRTDKFHLTGIYHPASKCGGDWWWFERHDDGTVWLIVGDVTGHGVGPAFLTASVATAFRATSKHARALDFQWRMEYLHREIDSVTGGSSQMTITAVTIEEATGRGVVYSAGGLPALCVAKDGKVRALSCRGSILGSPGELQLGRLAFDLGPDERVFLFTDGLPETASEQGKDLGLRQVRRILTEAMTLPLDQIPGHVVAQADLFRGNQAQADDITLIVGGRV